MFTLSPSHLNRNLDSELKTTHTQSRIFLIMARYCSLAVWRCDYQGFTDSLRTEGLRLTPFVRLLKSWIKFHVVYDTLCVAEWTSDLRAKLVKSRAWLHGLRRGGFGAAHDEAAGLTLA